MSSYFIFALVLTVLYIVYYAVNITRDLYGKKGTEKTDEEVFDLGPMDATEESVEVSENETGFSIGNETCDTEAVAAHLRYKTAIQGKRRQPRKSGLKG